MLLASSSLAYQQLKQLNEAEKALDKSLANLKQLPQADINVPESWSIHVHVKRAEGSLFKQQGQTSKALEAYTEAFDILSQVWDKLPKEDIGTGIPIYTFIQEQKNVLSANAVENLHMEFLELLSQLASQNKKPKEVSVSQVQESLIAHLMAKLNYLMISNNWRDADLTTYDDMLRIAKVENGRYRDMQNSLKNFSCPALRTIDKLWVKNSNGKFGFSVQKGILDRILDSRKLPNRYDNIGNSPWSKASEEALSQLDWKGKYYYEDVIYSKDKAPTGHLPFVVNYLTIGTSWGATLVRLAECGM